MLLSTRYPRLLAYALLAGLLAQANLPAQVPATIDVSKLGPQVGERVPDFNLKDQNGKIVTLQSIMGAPLFSRSSFTCAAEMFAIVVLIRIRFLFP